MHFKKLCACQRVYVYTHPIKYLQRDTALSMCPSAASEDPHGKSEENASKDNQQLLHLLLGTTYTADTAILETTAVLTASLCNGCYQWVQSLHLLLQIPKATTTACTFTSAATGNHILVVKIVNTRDQSTILCMRTG